MRVWPGRPYPLGATWDGSGTNFALYSENAHRVELCLFDSAESDRESAKIELVEYTDMVSWNCGVEGPTDDPVIRQLRERKKRNFIGTLLLSQGVPMLLAGDELGKTQRGNNNAYCQDNEISWINWDLDDDQRAFLDFTCRVIAVFRKYPVFQRRRFFHGRSLRGEIPDILWLEPAGREMSDEAWHSPFVKCFGVQFLGGRIDVDERGEPICAETKLLLFNADLEREITFKLPPTQPDGPWEIIFDTGRPETSPAHRVLIARREHQLVPCSMVLLRLRREEQLERA